MSAACDYLFLTLARAPQPHPALAQKLAAAGPTLQASGGEVVGQWAPQLGWANDEAAVLVRWRGERGDLGPIAGAQGVTEAKI
ncbi:MAG TPA: hypothetical protein VN694_11595, partial [Caulobacteraceae bacterium]|nr:hypothetical protein [Caulobacteraceae bacterium]